MQPVLEKVALAAGQGWTLWMRRAARFPFQWHHHPECELTFIRRGWGTRVVGDDVAPYGPGDLVLLGSHLPHTWASRSGRRGAVHEALVLQWRPDLLGPDLLGGPDFAAVAALLRQAGRGVRFTGPTRRRVEHLMQEGFSRRGLPSLIRLYEILDLLASARDRTPLATLGYRSPDPCDPRTRAHAVYQYLHQHSLEPLRLEAVARQFHMTPSTFHRFLIRTLGRTFVQLVNELRISHACSLLTQEERSVTEAAFASGFSNLSYFNRRFRAVKGMTPGDYRRRFQPGPP
jgi:AraC-like DNA-binding protein